MREFAAGRFATTAALALISVSAFGELHVTPSFAPSFFIDDNRRVRAEECSGLWASVTKIEIDTTYRKPTYAIDLNPKFRLTRGSSQKELDAEDYFVDLSALKNFERNQVFFAFEFSRASSATTELTDLGQIDSAVPRTTIAFNSSWVHSVTDRFSVTAFGGMFDVSFDQGGQSNLVDYRNSNAGLNLRYGVSEKTVILGNSSLSVFDTPDINSTTTSYTFQFGFDHSFSEILRAQILVGQNIGRTVVHSTQPIILSLIPLQFGNIRLTQESRTSGQIVNTLNRCSKNSIK